jgi:predicted nucleotidyltransferase
MSRLLRLNPNFKPAFDGVKQAKVLIAKLHSEIVIHECYLFGSSAEGKNTENSDLDILVVVANENDVKKSYAIVNKPFFSEIAVDWIIKSKDDFEAQKEIGGVCRIATLTGKRLV